MSSVEEAEPDRPRRSYLRRALDERKMSVAEFARRLNELSLDAPDYSTVARWVKGTTVPRRRHIELIADFLQLDRGLVRQQITEGNDNGKSAVEPFNPLLSNGTLLLGNGTLQESVEEIESLLMDIRRRTLLEVGGLGALGVISNLLNRADPGVEVLTQSTEVLGRKFNDMDLTNLDYLIDNQLNLLASMMSKSLRVSDRLQLTHFGGRLTVLKGTCAFFLGHMEVSRGADRVALQLAREANDAEIIALLRNELASALLYESMPNKALRAAEISPAVHSVAQKANSATCLALAYVRMDDFAQAQHAIAAAESTMEFLPASEDSSGEGPQWSFSTLSGHTRVAEAWLAMKNATKAEESLRKVYDMARRLHRDSPRWMLHAHVLEAQVMFLRGDPEGALARIQEVLLRQPQDITLVRHRASPILTEIAEIPRHKEEAEWLMSQFFGS